MNFFKKAFKLLASYFSKDSHKENSQGIDHQEFSSKQTFIFDSIFKANGPLLSTKDWSREFRTFVDVNFHFRESSQICLTVGSSWFGGDYMEFGSHDLNTFRNMLSAYNISGMAEAYPDVRFYAFDIFGKLDGKSEKVDENTAIYFQPYSSQGDKLPLHKKMVEDHGLYLNKTFLVQGLFKDTLTKNFQQAYLRENRRVGFAFLDCNIRESYRCAFEFIFPLLMENSFIYMDEYFQNPDVIVFFEEFTKSLRLQRNMGSVFVRNAGGFGALFRLFPIPKDLKSLELSA